MEHYSIIHELGRGNFAKVYLALDGRSGKQVALKVINKRDIATPKMYERVQRESSNMQKFHHPNIVEIYESFETDSKFVIAMEYVPGGELFDHVWEKQGISEEDAKEMFAQIVEAVHHCHKKSVVHRDLKLENIMLDRDGHPKLADFGFSKETHTQQMLATYCGSPLYASPEMILGKPYLGTECDVWSLGVVLFTMLTASMPFDDYHLPTFYHSVERGEYPEPPGTSELARDLISKMLDPNSSTRATIKEILAHPWMKTTKTRKTSMPSVRRQRKSNLIYSKSEAMEIAHQLAKLNEDECNCSCHKTNGDSVVTTQVHCPDCEDVQANRETMAQKMQMILRTPSECSSGYGSATGSEIFTPRTSQVSNQPTFMKDLRKYSTPRDLPLPTKRTSIQPNEPVSPCHEADDDDDLVFV